MEIEEKLKLLADSAKYDVSCASSGAGRRGGKGMFGSAARAGVCHSWGADGRCISLLKVLYSNACLYNCSYCVNRSSAGGRRVSFSPRELAMLVMDFYRRNYIEGLFLSSGVFADPDTVMERLVSTVLLLRKEFFFNGYIHMKAIPGASPEMVSIAGRLVDRMSVNIELPTAESLSKLAPDKRREDILRPMSWLNGGISRYRGELEDARRSGGRFRPQPFVPGGQSTQLIVGASPEPDRTILSLADSLYSRYGMKRVYYSAFVPPSADQAGSPGVKVREHRLYQADWLMRFYGFSCGELLDHSRSSLDPSLDPKSEWALRHRHLFPVDLEKADYLMLLRVPGIGVRSASRLVEARREGPLSFDLASRLGVVLSRARYFISCRGKTLVSADVSTGELQRRLGGGAGTDSFSFLMQSVESCNETVLL
jgi:putative DNA modification/repair radical SAM protein